MIAASCSLILISNQGTNVYFHNSLYVNQLSKSNSDSYKDNYCNLTIDFYFYQNTAFYFAEIAPFSV